MNFYFNECMWFIYLFPSRFATLVGFLSSFIGLCVGLVAFKDCIAEVESNLTWNQNLGLAVEGPLKVSSAVKPALEAAIFGCQKCFRKFDIWICKGTLGHQTCHRKSLVQPFSARFLHISLYAFRDFLK